MKKFEFMENVLAAYDITQNDLNILCKGYERFFKSQNIAYEYVGKEHVKEYALQEDFETGTSNGLRLSFEKNVNKAGGWHVRAYDMFHLPGHYCQWNFVGKDGKLQFSGDYAWEVGVTDFSQPDNATELAIRYESEAAAIASHFMKKVVSDIPASLMDETKKRNLIRFMTDYQAADKTVLKKFYDNGEELSHAELWEVNTPTITPIIIDLKNEVNPKERSRENLAIVPVLHFGEKTKSLPWVERAQQPVMGPWESMVRSR